MTATPVPRAALVPAGAVKVVPESDDHPPLLHADGFVAPVPVPGAVNTAGVEDSPFILPDGQTLYFFFTPALDVPPEGQILDGVTGIYASAWDGTAWSEPERVVLQDPGKLAGDGCPFVLADTMWFCSAREGYTGMHWYTAKFRGGTWLDWELADFAPEHEVGELHISADGAELVFASEQPGGAGGRDIWMSRRVDGTWQTPKNVVAVNTAEFEGWPALNPSGDELWFSRNDSIWRSRREGGVWQAPEMVIGPLAGEPSVDAAGNLYFVHHYFRDGEMVEADIYVAYRK